MIRSSPCSEVKSDEELLDILKLEGRDIGDLDYQLMERSFQYVYHLRDGRIIVSAAQKYPIGLLLEGKKCLDQIKILRALGL